MTQGKGIMIGFSILPVKMISGEMTGLFKIDAVLSRGVDEPLLD
jgi:hypothetical protein